MGERKSNEAVSIPRVRPRLMGRGVVTTEIDCPLCRTASHLNYGGATPKLSHLAGSLDVRLFCINRHGYVSDAELGR